MSHESERNKEVTINFFQQVFNHQNYDVVGETLGSDYHYNGHATSADGTVAWAKGLHQKYPDLHFTVEAILGEGEKVALRWRMDATDQSSGQKGYVSGTNILVFADGKAVSNDQGGGDEFIPVTPAG